MIDKAAIQQLKLQGGAQVGAYLKKISDINSIVLVLENLGELPVDFDGAFLENYATHNHEKVRFWAIKNIAKLKRGAYLPQFITWLEQEAATQVKREIVAAIGRLKTEKAHDILLHTLADKDAKVVCQAIRGLLPFKSNPDILERLQALINHPNETVRTVIYKEFSQKKPKTANSQAHSHVYDGLKNLVINADVLEVLPHLPDESVHLTFTSPPYYNARDYSIYESYEAYLNFLSQVFAHTHRITKEGRFLIVNTSPIIIPRVSRAHSSKRYAIPFDLHPLLVAQGWEFIDDIIWLKPEYAVKSRVQSFDNNRKPLSYKPNTVTEYLMVYRKQTNKLLDWNLKHYEPSITQDSLIINEYESNNVWSIEPEYDKIHPAVFPEDLCERVIRYYSFKNDLVFDPFAGSGTVGKVAKLLHRYFLLAEQEENYCQYMRQKIKPQPKEGIETRFLSLGEFLNQMQ